MSEEKTEPLWQAKPTPLFYVMFRFDAYWLGFISLILVLSILLHPERSLGAIGIVIALFVIYHFITSIWGIFRLAIESSEVLYEFDGANIIERIGKKTNETKFSHYTLAKSRHYCMFGHCCFHFREDERQFVLETIKKLSFQPKPHTTIEEVDTGKGIFGIRKEDAQRLREVLQTVSA